MFSQLDKIDRLFERYNTALKEALSQRDEARLLAARCWRGWNKAYDKFLDTESVLKDCLRQLEPPLPQYSETKIKEALRETIKQLRSQIKQYETYITDINEKYDDIRVRLRGHPDSVLYGESGLAAATMRSHDALERQNDIMREALEYVSKVYLEEDDSDNAGLMRITAKVALKRVKHLRILEDNKSATFYVFESGLKIRQLKRIIHNIPDKDELGNDREVWIETGKGLTSIVTSVSPLNLREDNSFDLLLESEAFSDD